MPDNGWLAEVYDEFRRPLFATAWNVLGCVSLSEDAVHTAFARMAGRTLVPDDPKTFAFRCVRNAAIDLLKSRSRRREAPIEPESEQWIDQDEQQDPRLDVIAEALNELDYAGRELILLHLQNGLTFREIGEILDEPLQTVASRYRRTLERLRIQLEVYRG